MALALLAECDGDCKETAKLINRTINEAPEGWVAFTINSESLHACSLKCAEKAALKKIRTLFNEHGKVKPAPRCG
jgi:hypothetical protein